MHFWEQRQALAAAPGSSTRSWQIQGAAGAQPESASPSSAGASVCIGEKPERRKRKSEAEETSAKPYACRFCSQSFDKSQALGGHMNRHRQEREREQLDNAQKLVLKQQGLQGLSGLPMQALNQRAKLQGPTSLLSFDQVTLSRYNQAVQYQSTPRTFLPGTYSTLHSGGLLNVNTGTWNLGGYGTGSIASGSSLGHVETSGDSSLARAIEAATPEDLFAASVLQSTATPPPTSLLPGRTNDTPETDAEQDMMYGYPGMANLTQTEASTSVTDKSPSCQEFSFNNVRHSFQTFAQGNVHLGLYPEAQAQAHGGQLSHAVAEVASPREPLGQSSDPTCTENDAEEQMKYGYSGVSTLTPCACQPDPEASTSGSDKSSCQQFNFGSHSINSFETVTQIPSSLAGNMPLFSAVQPSQLSVPQNQAAGDAPIPEGIAARGMCVEGQIATHQSMLFPDSVDNDMYKACAANTVVTHDRPGRELEVDCAGTPSPTLELVSFMGRSVIQDRPFLAAQMSETSGSWKEPGSLHVGSLAQTSSSSEQFVADSAPVSQNSPVAPTDGLALHSWMLGDRKGGGHRLVVENTEVLSRSVTSTLTPRAAGPAEQMESHRIFSSVLQEAGELDASGYIKVDDPSSALDPEYGSELEAENNPSYDNTTEQAWRSGSGSPSL